MRLLQMWVRSCFCNSSRHDTPRAQLANGFYKMFSVIARLIISGSSTPYYERSSRLFRVNAHPGKGFGGLALNLSWRITGAMDHSGLNAPDLVDGRQRSFELLAKRRPQ